MPVLRGRVSGLRAVVLGVAAIASVIALVLALRPSPGKLSIVEVTSAPEPDGFGPLKARRANTIEVPPAGVSFKVVLRGGSDRRPAVVTLTIAPRSIFSLRGAIRRRKSISVERDRLTRVSFPLRVVPFTQLETVRVTVTDLRRHETQARTFRVLFSLA